MPPLVYIEELLAKKISELPEGVIFHEDIDLLVWNPGDCLGLSLKACGAVKVLGHFFCSDECQTARTGEPAETPI
ncbi:MAG: hypothetical protein DMF43_05160 [Verrucomicrobia bacterium]|nr:MAG: hypothetical protein DMF43_05160 [Verrucomicrobiota bacterium]